MSTGVILFAMSWIGWLIILAGIYFVIVILRGFVDLVYWFIDEFFRSAPPRRRDGNERRPTAGRSGIDQRQSRPMS